MFADKPFDVNISHEIVQVLLDATSMFLDNIDLQEQLLFAISETITVAGMDIAKQIIQSNAFYVYVDSKQDKKLIDSMKHIYYRNICMYMYIHSLFLVSILLVFVD